jgi:hypothetical protein
MSICCSAIWFKLPRAAAALIANPLIANPTKVFDTHITISAWSVVRSVIAFAAPAVAKDALALSVELTRKFQATQLCSATSALARAPAKASSLPSPPAPAAADAAARTEHAAPAQPESLSSEQAPPAQPVKPALNEKPDGDLYEWPWHAKEIDSHSGTEFDLSIHSCNRNELKKTRNAASGLETANCSGDDQHEQPQPIEQRAHVSRVGSWNFFTVTNKLKATDHIDGIDRSKIFGHR